MKSFKLRTFHFSYSLKHKGDSDTSHHSELITLNQHKRTKVSHRLIDQTKQQVISG